MARPDDRHVYRFGRFVLDPDDRRLTCDGAAVALNARYLDALSLLVREHGELVSKTRFLEEVWRGAAVTDEALTQGIRSLRRALGDDANRPRFIETAPKHGYRFIAPVEVIEPKAHTPPHVPAVAPSPARAAFEATPGGRWDRFARLGRAGMIGGGAAGLAGGLLYGFVGVSDPRLDGGGASAVFVVACLTMLVGLTGGAGVGFGVAACVFAPGSSGSSRRGAWSILGGAAGGMVVGALVKLVGLDAFNLLFGQSPGDITGAPEGAALGAAVGLGAWLAAAALSAWPLRLRALLAGLITAAVGAAIVQLGGQLMGGSLHSLAQRFPNSRLNLKPVGALLGDPAFSLQAQTLTGALEGLLFGACVVAALAVEERRTQPLGSHGGFAAWPSSSSP